MQQIYLGIDVINSRLPFCYAALDGDLKLMAIGQGELLEVLAFAAGQPRVTVCITSPSGLNRGRMKQPAIRQTYDPPPAYNRYTNLRQAEYELERRGITIPHTPASEDECSPVMLKGFQLYRNLEALGYQPVHSSESRRWMETNSEVVYKTLLGRQPYTQASLEGRLQRQLILYEQDLPVSDPMRFFEEVTRFKLRNGMLPEEDILNSNELSALASGWLAWLGSNHPEKVERVGSIDEGLIYLPVLEQEIKGPGRPEVPFQNRAYSLPFLDKGTVK